LSRPQNELPSVFSLIWSRRRVAFAAGGAAFGAFLLYAFLSPAIWEAKATLIFPVRTPSLLGTGSFDQASLAATLTGGPTPLKVYGGMLESEQALSIVAEGAGLSRRKVRDMRRLQDQAMESSLTVSARHANPDLARKVVALHLAALEQINERVSRPLASSDADALAVKLAGQRDKVSAAEARLLEFQNRAITAPSVASSGQGKDAVLIPNGSGWSHTLRQLEVEHGRVASVVKSIQSRVQEIASQGGKLPSALPPVQKWRDKLTDMQYELKVQELTLASQAPELVKLRKQIALTETALRSELNKYAAAAGQGMVDPGSDQAGRLPELVTQKVALEAQMGAVRKLAKVAPSEAIELSRLTREVAVQSTILQQLQAQHELASLQAERDPNRWQVLDEPRVEDEPVNKSLFKNGAIATILGLAFGCFAALAWPTFRRPQPHVPSAETHSYEERAA
jgi:uncharacterized protein involved in exopolysaccharide biosynthesis